LLNKVDPGREIYLAVTDITYDEIFSEPIGQVVISDLSLKLIKEGVHLAILQDSLLPLV
jgi:hypothetical protein